MARQRQANEFNSFVGGLITEASPLTFPGNAALDINNFNIDKDGTISRRLGMDFEGGHAVIDSGVEVGVTGEISVATFTWDNAGGNPKLSILVVQTGNTIKFFDASQPVITQSLLHTYVFSTSDVNLSLENAVVDGVLVVVGGGKQPVAFTFLEGVITESEYTLRIRDVLGVEDFGIVTPDGLIGPQLGIDLRTPANVGLRPDLSELSSEHIYNLRNSTYAIPRKPESVSEDLKDPIAIFVELVNGTFTGPVDYAPSNADSVTSALFPDTENSGDRFTDRFFPSTLVGSSIGNFESPRGYFIIDALERGTSRMSEVSKLVTTSFPSTDYSLFPVTGLPLDRTPGGATAVGEYSGRVWYAGFSGEIISGDSYSPRMSSYVLFSRLVFSPSDLGSCHQIGDPTSKEAPDLLETDGGFIRLDEAYGIRKLVNIGSALIVVAENGVWAIEGGSDFGFTATTYKVSKITGHGCTNANSVVQVDNSVLYWGDDGIYQIGRSELGDLFATNITNATIQDLYDSITDLEKLSVQGHFDTYDRKVRWLYKNRVTPVEDTIELVLDTALGAFYKQTVSTISSTSPNIVAYAEVPPFKIGELVSDVVDGGVLVVDGGVQVTDTTSTLNNGLREIMYLTLLDTTPTVTYTLSRYSNTSFIDWITFDGTGVDSPAFILTGYNGGGDFQRYKQVPYITFHFQRTEDGFFTDGAGDIFPTHESSCKVQVQWEWANSAISGRWGREFQAYRYKRVYMPADDTDDFDNGFSLITTKNKLRGKGKVLSLLIKTEPLKDCKLLGWSTMTSVATNV